MNKLQPPRDASRCAYCGEPATTRDHVPPRGLFPKPAPSDLITVPSCQSCNNPASLDDELFRLALVFREELEDHPEAAEVARTAMRGLHRPERPGLRRAIISSLREFERLTPKGLYVGHGTAYSVPHSRLIAVSDRITRGLFYHHFGRPVPEEYSVTSRLSSTLDPDDEGLALILDLIESTNPTMMSVGSNLFQYRFGCVPEDPSATFWVLIYFGKVSFLSITMPP